MKRRPNYQQQGGRSDHSLRAIGYQLKPGGPLVQLIDGRSGGPVAFPKADVYRALYGMNNEAAHVMKAMERFDELKVIR